MARKPRPPRTAGDGPKRDDRDPIEKVSDTQPAEAGPGTVTPDEATREPQPQETQSEEGKPAEPAPPDAGIDEKPAQEGGPLVLEAGARATDAPAPDPSETAHAAQGPDAPEPGAGAAEPARPDGPEGAGNAYTAEPPDAGTSAAVPPVSPPPRRRAGLAPVLLGGALAAVLGFLAAQYSDPQGWPFAEPAPLDAAVAAQADRLGALETELSGLRDAIADLAAPAPDTALTDEMETIRQALGDGLAALSGRADTLDSAMTALTGRVAALSDRVDTIEREPIDGMADAEAAVESYRREVAELRALIESVIADNEALRAEAQAQIEAAEAAARAARARGALIRLEAALDAGGDFEAPLQELSAAGLAVPAALADHARQGVPTRASLQAGFAPAARAALAVAHRDLDGLGLGERVAAFFWVQFGIRSLTPRDGDDADAILSRAEAALAADDIGRALDEIAGLSGPVRAALDAWSAAAAVRHEAMTAFAALAAEIDTF